MLKVLLDAAFERKASHIRQCLFQGLLTVGLRAAGFLVRVVALREFGLDLVLGGVAAASLGVVVVERLLEVSVGATIIGRRMKARVIVFGLTLEAV